VNGSPQIVVDLSLVSLGGSIGSESFQSCPHSEDSNVSENSIHTSPYERPMSPVNGFKLRMSREESYLNESALSSVPTVIQSQRRILVPNSGHQNSPLRPMRLFSPAEIEQGPEKINCSTNSNAQENEIMRRLRMRAMSRHLRQQKRDATDHPGRRPNGDVCDQVPEILHATNHVILLYCSYLSRMTICFSRVIVVSCNCLAQSLGASSSISFKVRPPIDHSFRNQIIFLIS
jgi:hypothetical protein